MNQLLYHTLNFLQAMTLFRVIHASHDKYIVIRASCTHLALQRAQCNRSTLVRV